MSSINNVPHGCLRIQWILQSLILLIKLKTEGVFENEFNKRKWQDICWYDGVGGW